MEIISDSSPKVINSLCEINVIDLFNPEKTIYITRSFYERAVNWTMVSVGPNVYAKTNKAGHIEAPDKAELRTFMMKFKNFDIFYDYRKVISFHNYTGYKEADQIDENELYNYLIPILRTKQYIVGNCDVLGELYKRLSVYIKHNNIDFDLRSLIFILSPKLGSFPISEVCQTKLSHNSTTCSVCAIYLMSEVIYKECFK